MSAKQICYLTNTPSNTSCWAAKAQLLLEVNTDCLHHLSTLKFLYLGYEALTNQHWFELQTACTTVYFSPIIRQETLFTINTI